jgi:transglutaminase-like putative cysteine protease
VRSVKQATAFVIVAAALLAGCAPPVPTSTPSAPSTPVAPAPTAGSPTEVPTHMPTDPSTSTPTETRTPTPSPAATPTPLSTSTPTPRPWQTYRMEYAVRIGGVSKLWMPVPREWDGVGMTGVSVVDISPPPTDWYRDANGNEIAFWQIGDQDTQTYRVVFDVMVQPIDYDIDPSDIGEYDVTSPLHQRYTQASSWVQSDDPEIVRQARRIVGSETNPYRQAQLLHRWVADNIGSGPTVDALTALHGRKGSCAGHSALLIALLRALGIPARPVSGLHTVYQGTFESGFCKPSASPQAPPNCTVYQHSWTEFLLPGYGWVQCDASAGLRNFAGIDEPRIILSRGDVIELGHGYSLEPLFFFDSPQSDVLTGSTPPTQTWGDELTLTVERTG